MKTTLTIFVAALTIATDVAYAAVTDTQLRAAYCLGIYQTMLANQNHLPELGNPNLRAQMQELTRRLQERAAQMRMLITPTIFAFDLMEMAQVRAAVSDGEQYAKNCAAHYFDAGRCNMAASSCAWNRTPY